MIERLIYKKIKMLILAGELELANELCKGQGIDLIEHLEKFVKKVTKMRKHYAYYYYHRYLNEKQIAKYFALLRIEYDCKLVLKKQLLWN